MFDNIKNKCRFRSFTKRFRELNSHNLIMPKNIFQIESVEIGKMSYGDLNVTSWGSKNEKLKIGSYVSIGSNVKFILGGNHYYEHFSTYPFKVQVLAENAMEAYSKGKIIVEDDVWIGMDSTILSGLKIGQGAVIGTGSMVTKDVPPYSIVCGNPAKVVKYRFSSTIIEKLIEFDFNKVDKIFIQDNIEYLYQNLNEENIKHFFAR